MTWRALQFPWLLFSILMVVSGASAHPADISYLRVKVERQRLEMRFTFNLLTLTRFVQVDANGDNHIDKVELDAAESTLRHYLASHIQIRINDQPATLGNPAPLTCLWPSPEGPPHAPADDYGQRHVDFVFTQDVKPVLQDVWLGFDIWQQTGPLGTVEATYEQDDVRTQVPFSQGEPDYLYDTGYLVAGAPLAQGPFAHHPPAPWPLWTAGAILVALTLAVVRWRTRH